MSKEDILKQFPTIEDMMFGNKKAQLNSKRKKNMAANPHYVYRNIKRRRK